MTRAHNWGCANCKHVARLEHAHHEPLAGCKLWWLCWGHWNATALPSTYSHSFLFPWLAFQLFAVPFIFCFPPLCYACWWSQPGVQVLLVPLGLCTAAGKSSQTARLQISSPPALLPSPATWSLSFFCCLWGLVFLLAGDPLSKTVLGKPDSPVTVQLCYRS